MSPRSAARGATLAALVVLSAVGCSREPGLFSEPNARAHISVLADTIGSRPIGTPNNARARDYIVEQLRLFGFEVRVQEADARRGSVGRTARVANIIAVRQGTRSEAIGLLSHYDSVAGSPGAADDGLGVGVMLEAARVLAARNDRSWTLMILVTDGEEAGLMGAAALVRDREVESRLKTFINLDAIGSSGPPRLFESGPGNGWLVAPWAGRVPEPHGSSLDFEVYRRLPNDTDFSILKQAEIPGLNLSVIGDSYAYHTPRDTVERLSTRTVRRAGAQVVALATALDDVDITQRSVETRTYFTIGGTAGLSYGARTGSLLAAAALVLGALAWVKVTATVIRLEGLLRWLLTVAWTIVGAAIVVLSMIGATWLLRAVREVYHPWYARPDRLFLLLLVVGTLAGWAIARAGRWLPDRARGLRHPLVTWSIALPFWIALAAAGLWLAPGAAYLWVLPLLAAGLLLSIAPPRVEPLIRVASLIVLAAAVTLWLSDTIALLRFVVAIFGRLPLVTPVFVYAALMATAGIMIVPPLLASLATERPVARPSIATSVLLLALAATTGLAYAAPAYTFEQPLRRQARALQESPASAAVWEIGSIEPGLDLGEGAPTGWSPASGAAQTTVPWGPLEMPFVFRTAAPSLGPAPAEIAAFTFEPLPAGNELTISVVPREPGLTVTFLLPPGVTPARASLPGVERGGRWTAVYVAPPADGVALRAGFGAIDPAVLLQTRVLVRSSGLAAGRPGGEPQEMRQSRLPGWLPQERAVWTAALTWVLTPPPATIAPVRPLR